MPKQISEKTDIYFAFSVATRKGTAPGGFGDLISKLIAAGIKLRGLSAFVSGRRTKVYCVPDNAAAFRAFAKESRLRVKQKSVEICTGDTFSVMGTLNKWAISGEIPLAFNFSSRGEGFVYREVYTGPV
ncbi:MAG TPA: hypothetical protein VGQ81_13845 [Acidobacteriota bacterium]|jgi:hypothetical protein|nr:hypothetical protein [Acidobacteriota bacterium]